MKKTEIICDRCGKPVKYVGLTSRILNGCRKKNGSIKIRKYFNGNPDGYSYIDNYYEMCADCTKEFKEFIKNGGKNHETD